MRILTVLFACGLAACARKEAPVAEPPPPAEPTTRSSFIPDDAQLRRFWNEGSDPTLRKIAVTDYWLHYKLMHATGMAEALGGEEQAVSALKALGEAYERAGRGASTEIPKMVPAAFTGEGMSSGFIGMGMGSFVGMLTGGLVSGLSNEQISGMMKEGGLKHSNDSGKFEMNIAEDGSVTQVTEFDVNTQDMNGKVKLTTRMDTCPDENGKVTIEIDADSQMTVKARAGTGGYVKSQMKYERYLDDDAGLISGDDGGASNLRVQMGGYENFQGQSVDITTGYERGGKIIFRHNGEQGFSIFRPEEVEHTKKLLNAAELLQSLVAESMLRGMGSSGGSPWESGRCIDLKVKASPGKRSGLAPAAAFELDASPRVKIDGKPAGGSVTATLTGGAQLQPASGKVPADARFRYTGPDKKNESASIAFESRSRRGVGRATLDFDTRQLSAYRIEGGADEFHGSGVACDLGEQFFVEGSGVTVRFEPSSPEAGRYSYSGTMSGFRVYGSGTYKVSYRDGVAVSLRATGPGSVVAGGGTHTREGSEDYTLSPVQSAECAQ